MFRIVIVISKYIIIKDLLPQRNKSEDVMRNSRIARSANVAKLSGQYFFYYYYYLSEVFFSRY
jgi:hypothetical protein